MDSSSKCQCVFVCVYKRACVHLSRSLLALNVERGRVWREGRRSCVCLCGLACTSARLPAGSGLWCLRACMPLCLGVRVPASASVRRCSGARGRKAVYACVGARVGNCVPFCARAHAQAPCWEQGPAEPARVPARQGGRASIPEYNLQTARRRPRPTPLVARGYHRPLLRTRLSRHPPPRPRSAPATRVPPPAPPPRRRRRRRHSSRRRRRRRTAAAAGGPRAPPAPSAPPRQRRRRRRRRPALSGTLLPMPSRCGEEACVGRHVRPLPPPLSTAPPSPPSLAPSSHETSPHPLRNGRPPRPRPHSITRTPSTGARGQWADGAPPSVRAVLIGLS